MADATQFVPFAGGGGGGGGAVDVTDRVGRLLGIVASIAAAVDVSDRPARQLGIVSQAGAVDVSDRAGRALGIIASITAAVDVSDRAGRQVGNVTSTPVTATGEPVTTSGVTVTNADTAIIAANGSRNGLQIVNDSANVVYLRLGTGAAALNAGIRLNPGGGSWDGLMSGRLWRGAVRGIAAASSVVTLTEI